jgi:hypothetical protein
MVRGCAVRSVAVQGIMLIVCNRSADEASIPLRLLSIETGETLRTMRQPLKRGKKLDIIEQFNEKLMLKQEGSPLLIVDLLTSSVVKVKDSFFRTPSAFIFLYENQSFLAFKDNSVTVWNVRPATPARRCRARAIASHRTPHPASHTRSTPSSSRPWRSSCWLRSRPPPSTSAIHVRHPRPLPRAPSARSRRVRHAALGTRVVAVRRRADRHV